MGLGHSPSIVTNGLVFYYDMGNVQKSWKGAPTTNLISSPENLSSTRTAPASCGMSFTDYSAGGSINNGPFVRCTRTSTTMSADWHFEIPYSSVSTGTTLTFSCDARSLGGIQTIEFSNPDAQEVSFPLTQNWTRFSTQFTAGTQSGLLFMRINRSNTNTYTTGTHYDICNAQLEVKSFASPFVNGSRTTSDMIKDLASGTLINGNLTYTSTGAYFNGPTSFDYLYATDTWSHRPGNSFTYEAWFKHISDNGVDKIIVGKPGGHAGLMAWGGNQYFRLRDSTGFKDISISESYNTWYHLVGTYTAGVGSSFYRNGVLVGSNAFTTALSDYGTTLHIGGNIGWNASYSHNGNIEIVKVYNRALNASEVRQNFESLRRRFGI